MGHIHLSKVKFRNPIPDAILDRRSMFNDTVSEHFQGTKCCLNANMAHLQTQTAVDKNIWLMSNVPSEWLWPVYSFAYVEDTPLSNAQLLKQSICELEGDAFVGDILNQKRLVYSSLSQTGPEVRMVQSLTPIYEELSSMSVSHSKPEKHENLRPSAATVLKTLSHEEHESIILDHFPNHDFRRETLCASSHDAEESKVLQSCQPHKESSRSPTNYDVPSCERPPDVNSEMLSSTQPANEKDCPTHRHDTSQTMQEPTALDAVIDEGVIKSQMSQCPETKDSEGEIVELLRWLSSSQAADGIDVEDGELEENLVSQVLHSNSLEKALEKAKLDYENASQKECEDILYCSKAVEESKCKDEIMPQNQLSENITPEQCHLLIRSNVSIPQLDGCWDEMDRLSEFSSVQRKKKHRKAKSASSSESSKEEQSSAHAVWGSLPLAECEIQNHSAREPCSSSSKDACSFSELSRSSEKEEADLNVESGKNVNGQSLRDLMRKKRAWKPEISESKCYGDSRNNIQRQNTEYVNDNLICLDQGHKCHGSMGLNSSHQACEASHQLLAERSGTFSTTSEIRKCSGKFKPGALDENHPHYRALPLVDKREICFPTESNDKHQSADIHASIHNEKSKCHPAPDLSFPNQRSHTREDKNGFCSLCYNRENDLQEVCRGIASENISHNNIEKGQVSLEEHGKLGHRSLTLNDSLVQKHDDAAFSSSLHPLANEDASYDCNKSITSKKGCNIVEIWDSCTIKSDTSKDLIILSFSTKPPTKEQIEASFGDYSLTPVEHGKPYYGQMPGDISAKMDELTTSTTKFINVKEICPFFSEKTEGKERGMDTKLYMSSEFWDPYRSSDYITGICTDYQNNGSVLYLLTPSMPTPSSSAVKNWLSRNQKNGDDTLVCECSSALAKHNEGDKEMECQASEKPYGHMNACKMHHSPMKSEIRNSNSGERDISQISAPLQPGGKLTPLSQTGFRDPASVGAGQQLTLMSLEVYAESRGDLQPDPRYDAVNLIVAIVQEDSVDACATTVIIIKDDKANEYSRNIDGISNSDVFYVMDEITLFNVFIELIFIYDPDIIMGWEIQGGSIGYLAERAAYLGVSLLKKISRTPRIEIKHGIPVQDRKDDSVDQEAREIAADASDIHDTIIEDEWGRTHGSGIHIGGRIVLNLWRIMRGELNLRIYTLEAVAESVLRSRVPSIPCRTLTTWFSSGASRARHLCIEHLIDRTKLNLKIMFQLDMINRTSELARVFGIDFFSVLSRGSQYRVESMMLRLAHSQNFLAISPSKQQVALQPAMECLPLVMEPESKFYTDPVVVLDFQSLYPSMIIAYNLCFSTCLGKICPGRTKVLGVTSYNCDSEMLPGIRDNLFITPNGVMYISPQVRSGVLPRLLDEILTTRIMVKNAIKTLTPAQRVLQRVLNARQLALKLIANVTYGYTAAGFSGRMPCAELADSIVQCGRRTLENAINFVNSNSIWNARVVYGDTDSMFVLLKGRTREEAFKIGQEIASAVTARNPYPVTLKTEKVYYPCVLITKKRYVGYSYEHPTQEKPRFDAKGIETVRRDGCLAVAKILERSLRILFESCDLSEVKAYLYRQWQKILTGRISIQDFIFAKEVRLGTYSNNAHSLPPAAIVAMKAMRTDPRAEPRYGERIRYVVVHGEPGSRLGDMVVDPLELVDIHSSHRLHDTYYISKQIIPALQRVFTLVNADVKMWFIEMPRPMRPTLAKRHLNVSSPSGIGHFGGYHGTKTHKAASRSTIDHYYLSQHCIVCGEFIRSSSFVCNNCSKKDCIVAMTLVGRTSKLEKEIEHLTAICRHCGGDDRLSEKEVKCISLDCPVFFERRKVQKEFQVVSEVSMRCGFYPSCSAELF